MRGRLRFGAADELALSELPDHPPRLPPALPADQPRADRHPERHPATGGSRPTHLDLVFINQEADSGRGRLVRRDRLVWVGLERTQIEPEQPVPVITYHAPSLSRSAAISALGGGRPDLADHLQHPRDQRRAGGDPGRDRHLRAGPEPGAARTCTSCPAGSTCRRCPTWRWRWSPTRARPREPVEALSTSILNLPLAPMRR